MASQWYCQVLGEELGPIPWPDLVEMVRSGTVGRSDLVRREASGPWEQAEKVVGLFRAARDSGLGGDGEQASSNGRRAERPVPSNVSAPDSVDALNSGQKASHSGAKRKPASADVATTLLNSLANGQDEEARGDVSPVRSRWWLKGLMGITLVGMLVAGAGWWGTRQSQFPPHVLNASNSGVATPAHLLNAPVPKVPSIPGLPAGIAVPMPGFEELQNAYSPCLSADLKTIVFAHLTDGKTWFDLYVATRDKVDEPFGPPRLLLGCQSEELDAYPALSPNLRELIFVRSDDNPRLMHATRPNVDAEFGKAETWSASGLEQPGIRNGWPQFVDTDTVCFARQQVEPPSRQLWLARRGSSGEFAVSQMLPCQDPFAPWMISTSGVRAYFGNEEGVFVAARQTSRHPFGRGVVWADAALTGPIDGPIWVAPAEDVIVYCSAGPGQKFFSARKFWMFRKGSDG